MSTHGYLPGHWSDKIPIKLPTVTVGEVTFAIKPRKEPRFVSEKEAEIVVNIPSRLAHAVIDLGLLKPPIINKERWDGGSIGFCTDIYTRVKISVERSSGVLNVSVRGDRALLSKHAAIVFMKNIGTEKGFSINIESSPHPYKHVGLGSSAPVQLGTYIGLNYLFGSPYQPDDIIKISAFNYAEELKGETQLLYSGFSTGTSGAVAFYGEAVVTSSRATVVAHNNELDLYYIFFLPGEKNGGSHTGIQEHKILQFIRRIDAHNAPITAYYLLIEYIPALLEGDIDGMGDALWKILLTSASEYTTIGIVNKQFYVLDDFLYLRETLGVPIVFESSAGPGLAAISDSKDSLKEAIKYLTEKGYRIIKGVSPLGRGHTYEFDF